MPRIYKRKSIHERFWQYVSPEPNSGCWLWDGPADRRGYGNIMVAGRKHKLAHRIGYELLVGPIPNGLVLDHLCRTPSCVNPEHLRCVTNRENVLCGIGRSAENARKTYCAAGHEYTLDNIYSHSGRRHCRKCRKAAMTKSNEILKRRRACGTKQEAA